MAPTHRGTALLFLARLSLARAFVGLAQDASGAWWFTDAGKKFLSFSVNHVNTGGLDDGVGGREAAVCQAATNNSLCGDSLNFAGQLGYAPLLGVVLDKFGTEAAWAAATVAELGSFGFNGVSGWSHTLAERAAAASGQYYFHLLDMGTTWPHSGGGLDLDAFSAAPKLFNEAATASAKSPTWFATARVSPARAGMVAIIDAAVQPPKNGITKRSTRRSQR